MLRGTIYTLLVAVIFGLGVYAGRVTGPPPFPPETVEPPLANTGGKAVPCSECDGKGHLDKKCEFCAGTGRTKLQNGNPIDCPVCSGTGNRTGQCPMCNGTGTLIAEAVGGPFRPRPPKPDPPLPEPDTADFTPRERVLFGRFRELIDSSNARAEQRESRRDVRTAQQIEEALTEVSQFDPERIQAGGFWATVASKLWEWIKKAVSKIVETVMKAKALDYQIEFLKANGLKIGGAIAGIAATVFAAMWGFAKLMALGKKPA